MNKMFLACKHTAFHAHRAVQTEERACILSYVMFRKSFRAVEVSRDTGVTKGLVSRYLRILELQGLLQKKAGSIPLKMVPAAGPSDSCSTWRE